MLVVHTPVHENCGHRGTAGRRPPARAGAYGGRTDEIGSRLITPTVDSGATWRSLISLTGTWRKVDRCLTEMAEGERLDFVAGTCCRSRRLMMAASRSLRTCRGEPGLPHRPRRAQTQSARRLGSRAVRAPAPAWRAPGGGAGSGSTDAQVIKVRLAAFWLRHVVNRGSPLSRAPAHRRRRVRGTSFGRSANIAVTTILVVPPSDRYPKRGRCRNGPPDSWAIMGYHLEVSA